MNVVVIDSGPLGILANPRNTRVVAKCRGWIARLQSAGRRVILPEIADYEIRRELLLNNSANALAHLDWLCGQLEYLPITTAIMRQAAALWASARQGGQPTSGAADLDADVIVAAQALSLGDPDVVVGTINVAHLSRFVNAELWSNIVP